MFTRIYKALDKRYDLNSYILLISFKRYKFSLNMPCEVNNKICLQTQGFSCLRATQNPVPAGIP